MGRRVSARRPRSCVPSERKGSEIANADAIDPTPALSARGVRKQYGGVHALDGVDIAIAEAEVHAILGENGAGKSTLVKVVAGVVRPDAGEVSVQGKPLNLGSPHDARAAGVAVVYQELSLIPQLSVTHNLVLSDLPLRGGLFSPRRAKAIAEEALAKLGLVDIDPRSPVSHLPLDQQQMVEIAKATMAGPRILILDEATSSLGGAEVNRLFELVRALRDQGTTVVVITHRMHEVWALADSMTILRDGRTVGRHRVGDIDQRQAVTLMAGRDIRAAFPAKGAAGQKAAALELRDVRLRRGQKPWQLSLYRGEILGVGGLQGQGQRRFLHWLYGAQSGQGTVERDGRQLRIRRPGDALRHGIVLIPEDRAAEGLHLNLPVRWNIAMATLRRRAWLGVMRPRAEKELAARAVGQMSIKIGSPFQAVSSLSGGTQQKVVIGKFMEAKPDVLLFVDSTRGIDVQTKFELYEMLRRLADGGAACVVYSSDTEELVGLCDRVAVFHDGVPAIMLEGENVTQDAVVSASFAVARGA
ncbi:MAG: sugar ABC transporter ATP-binding protein [Gaiellaceae bacterium]